MGEYAQMDLTLPLTNKKWEGQHACVDVCR